GHVLLAREGDAAVAADGVEDGQVLAQVAGVGVVAQAVDALDDRAVRHADAEGEPGRVVEGGGDGGRGPRHRQRVAGVGRHDRGAEGDAAGGPPDERQEHQGVECPAAAGEPEAGEPVLLGPHGRVDDPVDVRAARRQCDAHAHGGDATRRSGSPAGGLLGPGADGGDRAGVAQRPGPPDQLVEHPGHRLGRPLGVAGPSVVVEGLPEVGEADRLPHGRGVQLGEDGPQVLDGPEAAGDAAVADEPHGLAPPRGVEQVDGLLQARRVRVVVLGGDDEVGVGPVHPLGERLHLGTRRRGQHGGQPVLGEVDHVDEHVVAAAGLGRRPPGDDVAAPALAGAADDDGEVDRGRGHRFLLGWSSGSLATLKVEVSLKSRGCDLRPWWPRARTARLDPVAATSTDTRPAAARPVAPPQARPAWRAVALPDEHGGWGLSAEPALLGLLVAPSWAGGALAAGAVLAFLARTPLKLVLVDRWRGRWLPRTRLAARVAAAELALLAALGAAALALAGPAWLVPVAAAAPLVAVELWFDMRSRGRRLTPELCGAIGVSAVAAAVALAGGAPG